MLMKIKSVSKSTPKFFTQKANQDPSKLYFNDSKQSVNKPNMASKKILKANNHYNKQNTFIDTKSNPLEQKKREKIDKPQRLQRLNEETLIDNEFQMQKRRIQMNQMNQRLRKIEDSFNKVKSFLDSKNKNSHVINNQGKVNSVAKNTISSINSFVTQMKIPLQLHAHSSSESNLLTIKQPIKILNHKYYVSTIVSAFNSRANTTFMQICKTHLTTSLQLLKVLKNSERPQIIKPIKELKPTNRNTIIFDLDQTLIHCNDTTNAPHDILLDLSFPGGETAKAGINVRPRAIQTLKTLSKYFQIIVFTASHQCYGSVVCDYLDPFGQYIAERYYRDSCYRSKQGYYIKDLRVIDRPMQKMLLIDNAAYSYAFQIQNGVPIIPYYDCKTDQQLKHLVQYLIPFADSKDVRVDHCKKMKVDEYSRFDNPVDLISQLYADELSK